MFTKRVNSSRLFPLLLSILILGAWLPAIAQTSTNKAPLTHETMWMMKRVGAPAPSPDGNWVVFSLVEPAYDEKDQVSDLWIVPTDGSTRPRRLTFSKGGESGVAWSPDSRRIAFSARREGDEANQLYVLDVANGGEAVRITSLSTGARSAQWRPDGKALLFVSTVYPGAANDDANKKIAAERKAQKYRVRVYDRFPIRYWDRWLDDTQTHLFVQTLEPGAKAKDLLAGTKLVAEAGFAGRALTSGDDLDAAWTPDGSAIVFVATTAKNSAAYAAFNTNIYLIKATGGEPQQIASGDGSYSRPVFDPKGESFYAVFTQENGKTYNLVRLAKFTWPSTNAKPVILTANFDRSVG